MKILRRIRILVGAILVCMHLASCEDKLTETNIDPNVVDPSVGNPNMIMPTVLTAAATDYLNKGWDEMAGVVQHIQHDGWFGGINHYAWEPENWTNYYDMLRNNAYLMKSEHLFHQGVALTMKSFIFGMITDLWGDAPYSDAVKGDQGIFEPKFDSQEVIYQGILTDLQKAADLFAINDNSGYLKSYDVYYAGDPSQWHKFANSLLLRYALRVSDKMPEIAKACIEKVYQSGVYIKDPSDDATISYVGSQASNSWPYNYDIDDSARSNFRRRKPGQALIDQFLLTNDPRLRVWWDPVHVQWIADTTLDQYLDNAIRKNGVKLSVTSMLEQVLKSEIDDGNKFTRHFNPKLKPQNGIEIDTNLYVGVPAGLINPDYHNGNPTPGQEVENQHVSQLSELYRHNNDRTLLKGRIISSAEVSFIFAEAALKGWNVGGSAEEFYYDGIKKSLRTWKVEQDYDKFIQEKEVKFNNTDALKLILTQKWIAGWTGSTEAWMDYRRTGLPEFKAGPASAQPVLPVRFIYGGSESLANGKNMNDALGRLEQTSYADQANSQWSKPWIIQSTGKPW